MAAAIEFIREANYSGALLRHEYNTSGSFNLSAILSGSVGPRPRQSVASHPVTLTVSERPLSEVLCPDAIFVSRPAVAGNQVTSLFYALQFVV
jgi:hypothetical protein